MNEEKNISYTIESVKGWTDVFVVDLGKSGQAVQPYRGTAYTQGVVDVSQAVG